VTDERRIDALVSRFRDPARWFCAAFDETEMPRVWARGNTEAEARKRAELAATEYRDRKQSHRVMVPRWEWTFVVYPPEEIREEETK
jgi:hypothetical protein